MLGLLLPSLKAKTFYLKIVKMQLYQQKIKVLGNTTLAISYSQPIAYGYLKPGSNSHGIIAESDSDYDKNSYRAKSMVRDLIYTNYTEDFVPKFLTLTYRDNQTNLAVANTDFHNFQRRLQYYAGKGIRYLAVPEFQKRGAVHYHVIIFNLPFTHWKTLTDIWKHGDIDIERVRATDDDLSKVAFYLTKYITKEKDDRLRGQKTYFPSRSLARPIVSVDPIQVSIAQSKLNALTPLTEYDYSNEHVKTHTKVYNLKSHPDILKNLFVHN